MFVFSGSLKAIADTEAIRVPKVKGTGSLPTLFNGQPGNETEKDRMEKNNYFLFSQGSYLVLEHIYMREIASYPKEQVIGRKELFFLKKKFHFFARNCLEKRWLKCTMLQCQ